MQLEMYGEMKKWNARYREFTQADVDIIGNTNKANRTQKFVM